MSTNLVTGAAGFIGYHTAKRLLSLGHTVIGVDSFSDYYSPSLKHARIAELKGQPNWHFYQCDISDEAKIGELIARYNITHIIHLAAQPGVRYSMENPHSVMQHNCVGFLSMLENARKFNIQHFVYASSSSVYGDNPNMPLREDLQLDQPISLYAASKKSNELMAYTYAHLYQISVTGLRFFTVYGPWGRPDMALFKFVKAIEAGEPIDVYNHGEHRRDFTYIDDIVNGVISVLGKPGQAQIFNIGRGQPENLLDFIRAIEAELGGQATLNFLPQQPGDVHTTWADTTALQQVVDYTPQTDIKTGIRNFITWYRDYYG